MATSVPQGLKRPGVMVVAPRNAPANAGSKKSAPEEGSAPPIVPAYRTPAAPATVAAATSAPNRARPTRTPLSRATLRPRPVNRSRRPSGVNSSRYHSPTQRMSPYQKASGIPSSSQTITGFTSESETPPTVSEPLIQRTSPETKAPVPRVVMKESSSSSTTSAPLTTPTIAAATTPATSARPIGQPSFTFSSAVTIADSDRTEATDRS